MCILDLFTVVIYNAYPTADNNTIIMPRPFNTSSPFPIDNLATPQIARRIAKTVTHDAFSLKTKNMMRVTNIG